MKLRSQVSLLLFLFGLAPLLIAIVINVPLLFDRLEHFYHRAYLQQLRLDFHDLDQHITRRHEMTRLLAKFPDPGLTTLASDPGANTALSEQRTAYLAWVNQALFNETDITEIVFINTHQKPVFWLHRESSNGIFIPSQKLPDLSNQSFIESGLNEEPGVVITSPISLSYSADAARKNTVMTLRFITPVLLPSPSGGALETLGAVIFSLDVGGLSKAYQGIHWVRNNGDYLEKAGASSLASNAFSDFPGLQSIFKQGELALWEHNDNQVFWLPMFPSEDEGPIWVGRNVDPSPITSFSNTLKTRLLSIMAGLLLIVFFFARKIALRIENVGKQLTNGIASMLEENSTPEFRWKRPDELKELATNLTVLSEKHLENSKIMRKNAQQLEESNYYKSEFLANVSHELRTPLNSILLLSKLLANKNNDAFTDEDKAQAHVIHSAGIDLKNLIDTILDLSKIEAGEINVDIKPFHSRVILDSIVALLQPQIQQKGLSFNLLIGDQAPELLSSDAEKLRHILINFLSNAVKFTTQGSIQLTYSNNISENKEQFPVVFRVIDTGIGIALDKQSVIFDAFKQADGSTSRYFGGTGLGLTISRELAQLIGGHITIDSEPGNGSTFSLFLPNTATIIESPVTSTSSFKALPDIPEANYRGKCVLLVDDDLRNLLALTPLLERWGFEVIAAGDGAEAIDTASDNLSIDIVLMDIMMPGMNGYETTKKLRQNSRYKNTPVIAVSAKADATSTEQAFAATIDDFIVKPVDPDILKMTLDKYLVKT